MKQTTSLQYNRLMVKLLNGFEEHDNIRTPYFSESEKIKYDLCKTQRSKDKWMLSCINGRKDSIKIKKIIMALSKRRAWEHLEDILNGKPDLISEQIENYVKVSKSEKNKYAEVFTRYELVEEMLDVYPKNDWENPNLKWIDMANGIGNFSWRIIVRLYKGLKDVPGFENPQERYKHIINNMIYVCDIQTKNMFLWLKRVDYFNEYKPNYFFGDSLKNTSWENIEFDRHTMNPPYNDGDKPEEANKLYPKFMHKALLTLKDGGYLNMITPTAWFTNTADIGKGKSGISMLEEFKKYNLLYLNPNSNELKDKYFPDANSTFCYYLVQKSQNYTTTNINGVNVDISEFDSLPKITEPLSFSIVSKYLSKSKEIEDFKLEKLNWVDQNHNLLSEEKNKVKSDLLKEETEILKYKNFHTPALPKKCKEEGIIDYTYLYSSNEHKYRNNYKVIVSMSGKYVPVADKGTIGFTNMCAAVILKEGENIEDVVLNLNNKLYRFLIELNRSAGFVPRKFLLSLPKLSNMRNDNDVFNYFGINQEEILFIDKVLSGEYAKERKAKENKKNKENKNG
jgi:hypothetical protein